MSAFYWPHFFTFIGGMLVLYWLVFVVAVGMKDYLHDLRVSHWFWRASGLATTCLLPWPCRGLIGRNRGREGKKAPGNQSPPQSFPNRLIRSTMICPTN